MKTSMSRIKSLKKKKAEFNSLLKEELDKSPLPSLDFLPNKFPIPHTPGTNCHCGHFANLYRNYPPQTKSRNSEAIGKTTSYSFNIQCFTEYYGSFRKK